MGVRVLHHLPCNDYNVQIVVRGIERCMGLHIMALLSGTGGNHILRIGTGTTACRFLQRLTDIRAAERSFVSVYYVPSVLLCLNGK